MTLEVEGLANVPSEGPVILAANHLSNQDVFPMQLSLERPVFFMAKAELFRSPALDWALRQLGGFPVFRGERDEWTIRHAHKVLENGQVLGIFPEGTRSHGRGLAAAKTGAARLAIECGAPIVPLAIVGKTHPSIGSLRRGRVRLKFLRPIMPDSAESLQALTTRVMLALASALPRRLGGVYATVDTVFESDIGAREGRADPATRTGMAG